MKPAEMCPRCLQGQGLPPQKMAAVLSAFPLFSPSPCFLCTSPFAGSGTCFPISSAPLISLMFISFRRPILVEQLRFFNILLFDEVRVWEVLEDCLEGSVRFMCRTRQKKKKISFYYIFGARIVPSLSLAPHGWEERKSSSCCQYAFPEPGVLFPVSMAHPWTCRCSRIFQELLLSLHKSSRAQEWFSPQGGGALSPCSAPSLSGCA